ncbi:MAG: endonuclease VII domain-containing protein [Aeromonadaceae bacterium]
MSIKEAVTVTISGIQYESLSKAAKIFGIKPRTLTKRLSIGWSVEEAFGIKERGDTERKKTRMATLNIEEVTNRRKCTRCGKSKEMSEYPLHKSCVGGRAPVCRRCKTDGSRKKRYGVTSLEYDEMLKRQGGVCAICGSATPKTNKGRGGSGSFCVDHCHSTGKIRGLLCMPCNVGLGKFNDEAARLESAIRYLNQEVRKPSMP